MDVETGEFLKVIINIFKGKWTIRTWFINLIRKY